ncbi:MAG: DpnII family type II restriction endonuclease [Dehalococcoidales bacterium]|nr:DpnII family type II restriction endonuclease [Dehalococcoidales bacterium]
MLQQPSSKPTFDEFIKTCTPLLKIPELENQMRERVRNIVKEILDFKTGDDPAINLKAFIQKDQNFLGVLLALTNLSQEKFLRLLTAQRFVEKDFGREWTADTVFNKIKADDNFAEHIAKLFLEGKTSKLLAEQVADFYLDQLSLPRNWSEVIRDENVVGNVVRKKLVGEYTDQKGAHIEKRIENILDGVQTKYGITHAHGQVALVGKEIDHAIPSLGDPYVMVMSCYMETTSSSQTTRANEQQAMFQKIVGENVRYAPKFRAFVNIVDGAGWLARRSDLMKMFTGCHYCLNMKTLSQLEDIILKHVPDKYKK